MGSERAVCRESDPGSIDFRHCWMQERSPGVWRQAGLSTRAHRRGCGRPVSGISTVNGIHYRGGKNHINPATLVVSNRPLGGSGHYRWTEAVGDIARLINLFNAFRQCCRQWSRAMALSVPRTRALQTIACAAYRLFPGQCLHWRARPYCKRRPRPGHRRLNRELYASCRAGGVCSGGYR